MYVYMLFFNSFYYCFFLFGRRGFDLDFFFLSNHQRNQMCFLFPLVLLSLTTRVCVCVCVCVDERSKIGIASFSLCCCRERQSKIVDNIVRRLWHHRKWCLYAWARAKHSSVYIGAAAPDIIITRLQSSIWWLEMSGSLGPIHTAAIQRRERAIYYRTHQHNHLIWFWFDFYQFYHY